MHQHPDREIQRDSEMISFSQQNQGISCPRRSIVTFRKPAYERTQVNLALEASIHIGLAILLATACLLILRPFIPLLAWGIIIAVSAYPAFQKLQLALGGRGVLTAILFTVLLLAFLTVPVVLLAGTLVEGIQTLTAHFKDGTFIIPPPPLARLACLFLRGMFSSLTMMYQCASLPTQLPR